MGPRPRRVVSEIKLAFWRRVDNPRTSQFMRSGNIWKVDLMGSPKPVVLCIMDGWGLNPSTTANAVALADTPNFDRVMRDCPNATLTACGEAVGLPDGQIGNSEVGHMNIGAGRVVWMDLPKINKDIASGQFEKNAALGDFASKLEARGGVAHIAGLLSPGGVHSHQDHLVELARVLTGRGLKTVIHAFLDGRDVPPKSALGYLDRFQSDLPEGAAIASVCGRFYAMDRDNRWERVSEAYEAICFAKGASFDSAQEAVKAAYSSGDTDEFVPASIIGGYGGAQDGDGLIFANFRADRAREILSALLDPHFDDFDLGERPRFAAACGMVEYSERHNDFMDVMYPSEEIKNTLGAYVASKGKTQFRLAETEKYPHVTFFFNGGEEAPNEGETRYMAPSPKVRTYDMQPEMSSGEVTEQLVKAIKSQDYDLIVVNYANPDMVGHTGDLDAAMAACASVDRGVGAAIAALNEVGGAMLLTADHGNCDMMVDPDTGEPHTAHTLNPVPVVLIGGPDEARLRDGGKLADLAPSLLELMGLKQPSEMTGESLLVS